MSTSWTAADVTALEGAIKQGITKVKYRDREVTYASLDTMLKLLDRMRRETGTRKPAYGYVAFDGAE